MTRLELQGTVKAASPEATLPGPAGKRCVLVSSWESGRSFPRTRAGVVAFELAAGDGQTYRIEPAAAAARVTVRSREPGAGGHRETGFIAVGDRIEVHGHLDTGTSPPVIAATLIAQPDERPCGVAPHRLPPGALTMAQPPVESAPSATPEHMLVAEPPSFAETPPPEIVPDSPVLTSPEPPSPPPPAAPSAPAASAPPVSPVPASHDDSRRQRRRRR